MQTKHQTGLSDVIESTTKLRTSASQNIDGIRAVTTQLRVLAMNALIEASRAGTAGLGFGVVADEVKAVSASVEKFAETLSKELGGEIASLERQTRAMATEASGQRLVDLSLNAIEIMDRNLYERTCDVRWWATDAAVVDAASDAASERAAYASKRLAIILKAYTVYLDIWLCDRNGRVIANGRPDAYPIAGAMVQDRSWFREGLSLADGDSYVAADVGLEPLLNSSQVATYVASVREGGESRGRPLGLLAVHFDWEPQARTIVKGVRLTDEERGRTRVMLTDKRGLILAASDGRGVLSERVGISFGNAPSGYEIAGSKVYAFHKTPGYETYAGREWYGVIEQTV